MPLIAALSLGLSLVPGPTASLRPPDLPMPPPGAFPVQAPPSVDAAAWMAWSVVEDAEIGSLHPDRVLPQASITKLMTAILAVEHSALTEPVTIGPTAASTPIGFIGQPAVRLGEVWLVGQLLENIMVQSGNDAAAALAEHVAGSIPAFVALMNRRADEIGMTSTVFVNPHGLDADGQMSTARDLVRLGLEALNHPDVMAAARIKHVTFSIGARRIPVTATNRDIGVYPGLLGLKTGDTLSAGQVLLSYTETARGGIVAVVLGSTNRRAATREIVTWASGALGPRDYFFAPAVSDDLVAAFPAWYQTRLRAAGTLPTGDPRGATRTPLVRDLEDRFRELLPGLLGGSP